MPLRPPGSAGVGPVRAKRLIVGAHAVLVTTLLAGLTLALPAPASVSALGGGIAVGCVDGNLSGTWNPTDVFVTYSCLPSGPAFAVGTTGEYTATVTHFDSRNATDLYVYQITTEFVPPGSPPADCAALLGALPIHSTTNDTTTGEVDLLQSAVLGDGYSYCEDAAPGAAHINGFAVSWAGG